MSIGEVAEAFGVKAAAVRKWGDDGRLTVVRTPGNQRRFLRAEVERILEPIGGIDAKSSTESAA